MPETDVDTTKTTEEPTTGTPPADGDAGDKVGEKSFTQKDIDAEADRRVSQAHEKWKVEQDTASQEAKDKAEQERLKEQGEWQKVAEESQAKLEAVTAERTAAKFEAESRAALTDAGVPDLADIILTPRSTVESVAEIGKALRERIDALATAEVDRRLQTGDRPHGGEPPVDKSPEDMTAAEWQAHKKQKGIY